MADLRERLIPNRIPLGIGATWLAWRIAYSVLDPRAPSPFPDLIAAVAVGSALLTLTLAFEALVRRPGMGGGDIKLITACALYLGLEGSALCLLVACAAAIPLALIIPRTRFARADERMGTLPFAPAIALGVLVAFLPHLSCFRIA